MSLKSKTPPPLDDTVSPAPTQQARQVPEERWMRVNPEIDQRLNTFIKANPALNEYYANLVKQDPERAVRSIMLNKMFKHEASQRKAEQQAPQVQEWVNKQEPTLRQSIMDRLQKINPFYRQRALVNIAAQEKARIDFAPPVPRNSQGISI